MQDANITFNPKPEVGKMRAKASFSVFSVCVVCCLLSFAIGIMPVSISQAAVPDSINYQGKLIRAGGGPVNGTYDLTFSIYPDDLGSSADWTETQLQVEVEHGVFSVLLGSVNPISASLFDGGVKYLGVKVQDDPEEMRPLKPMVTTSYAFRSQETDTAEYARTAPPDDDWDIDTAGFNVYRLTGNVGIGTPSPQGKLDINGPLAVAGDVGTDGQFLKSQGAGANPVWSQVIAVPADNSVSQTKLKTTTGEVSKGSGWGILTLPGGSYGFYPQFKLSGADLNCTAILYNTGYDIGTSYVTVITMSGSAATIYAQQRYITASGKDHWMFFLGDKVTRQILASYQAPDHPCYGSGGDENDIPHPFGSYDLHKHEVILVDNEILPELKAKVTSKRSLLTVINEDYEIDFDSEPAYQPREIIEIDEYGDKKGEILQTIKTPEWAKILIGKDEIFLRRRLVETLPPYMSYKKLKPKSDARSKYPVLSQRDR